MTPTMEETIESVQKDEPSEEPTSAPTEEPAPEPTPTPEPVHEHSYTETIIKEGSCTSWGTKLYTCSCGYSYEKEYLLDHVRDESRVVTREPTCTVEGTISYPCMYCDTHACGLFCACWSNSLA